MFLIVSLSLHSSVSPGFDAVDLPGSRLGARGSDGFIAAGSRAVQIPTASWRQRGNLSLSRFIIWYSSGLSTLIHFNPLYMRMNASKSKLHSIPLSAPNESCGNLVFWTCLNFCSHRLSLLAPLRSSLASRCLQHYPALVRQSGPFWALHSPTPSWSSGVTTSHQSPHRSQFLANFPRRRPNTHMAWTWPGVVTSRCPLWSVEDSVEQV